MSTLFGLKKSGLSCKLPTALTSLLCAAAAPGLDAFKVKKNSDALVIRTKMQVILKNLTKPAEFA